MLKINALPKGSAIGSAASQAQRWEVALVLALKASADLEVKGTALPLRSNADLRDRR